MYVQCSSSTSAYSHADLDWVYGVVWARLYSRHCQLLGVIRVQHGELAERLQHNWWNCKCSFFPFFLSLSPIHITHISHKPFSLFSLSLPPSQRRREVVHTINDRIIIPLKKVGLSCYTLVRAVGVLWTAHTLYTMLQSQWLHIMMYFFCYSCFQSGESYQRSLLPIGFW